MGSLQSLALLLQGSKGQSEAIQYWQEADAWGMGMARLFAASLPACGIPAGQDPAHLPGVPVPMQIFALKDCGLSSHKS